MTTVTIRRADHDTALILVDGRPVFSASNLDENGGREGEPSVAWAAQLAAQAVAQALGATVTIEKARP